MRVASATALLLSLVMNAWAGQAGWTEPAAVAALEPGQDGRFILRLALKRSVSGCRSADGFYADYGHAGSELMYDALLEALRSRLSVQVYATGGCDLNGLSAISSVRVLP